MISSAQIKTIQDIMRKDRGINGDAQRIEQLVWMIFLKVLDDREREYELLDDKYRSPNPYTGIKTNLLFFEKGRPTKEIWYYEHPYPPGQKSYNKTNPIRIEEFEPEKKWWKKRKAGEFAWKVPVQEIKDAGYNLDRKNPHATDDGHGDPDELLRQFQALQGQIEKTRDRLKQELMAALGGK